MKKSIKIENEILKTVERIDELYESRNGIKTNLETLQAGFVDGATPLDELQAGQARLDTLESSIAALNAKRSELQTSFDETLALENHQSLLDAARATADQAASFFDEAMEIRQKANDLIASHAEMYMEKIGKFHILKKQYNQIRAESDCETPGISTGTKDLLERNYENFPTVKFAPSFHIAVGLIAHEINRLDFKSRRAAFAVNEKSPKMSENVR
jgi:uncharacterized coiled-coil DUF342 family protein